MASTTINTYNNSYSPSPPSSHPPPPGATPPPPLPPHPFAPPPPHELPPPHPHPIAPPPHHVRPPPPAPHHPTIIVIVFISCGGFFFFAFMAAALICWMKKKKKKKMEPKTELIHFEEHRKVKEAIVEGPHGREMIVLSVEDDVVFDEEIKKREKIKELHAKKGNEGSSFIEIERASFEPSDYHRHHHHEDRLAEHKG